jgi:dihydroflavonol-4-reductase
MTNKILLVTGANGLLGSNLCLAAARRGYEVRALMRAPQSCAAFTAAGIAVHRGDVTDLESIRAAASGAGGIVHAAAVLGGTWSKATPKDYWDVNYRGTVNVMEVAHREAVARIVDLDTLAILDWAHTITERSPIAPISPDDSPYIAAKRAAYYEGMHRAARGQHITFVTPAGIYGPGPFTERVLHPTSFTGTVAMALGGQLAEYVRFPLLWAYVDDVAAICLAALERGRSGERYLACGRVEDACSIAELCNHAAALAGVPHRVRDVDLSAGGGAIGSMAKLAARHYADPLLDSSGTQKSTGIAPLTLDEGLRRTVEWLGRIRLLIPTVP